MSLLEVRNLTVAFGSTEVVRGVSFTVEAGERVCLIGESGSGKSMTAMAIQGLLPRGAHVTGSIRFEGRELVGASDAQFQKIRGRRIGCIFQEPHTALNPVVRIKHQLVAASRIHAGLKNRRRRSGPASWPAWWSSLARKALLTAFPMSFPGANASAWLLPWR
ncbi:ATP-binding cassette domain-containing protein [Actinotignum sanguinis]|uniref:ATP-binding cassette domain-containing protein n=1 Tax=Actinotignum sanguinis TaxID=1445614 RepID=UPI0029347ECF|nr:ATP-binding cassette domain-containing protein [Actinotignum sanguinis]MDV2437010.1 ATP-binding cassette domain-containing protein [Actinotignum sanguinis]